MVGNWNKKGFTLVEIMIVIVLIGILAAIGIVGYNGARSRAETAKRDTDMQQLLQAIMVARKNENKRLGEITGSYWSVGQCTAAANNPSGTEPRDLPKSHACWQRYYTLLTNLGNAADMNLDGLRAGDKRGNPYMFDENEGETSDCATDGNIGYFTGTGVSFSASGPAIPKYLPRC